MLLSVLSSLTSAAWSNPTQPPCIREEQVDCVPLTEYGLVKPLSVEDVLPTPEQLQPLLKDHRQTSRRGNKVQTEPISDDESLDWLLDMGKESKVILIGEDHSLVVTPTLQLQMVTLLIEQAEYRQIVQEAPYSFTPIYNAYVQMEDADEAAALIKEYLYDQVKYQTQLALLNVVRQHNLQHPERSIAMLTTDVEHKAFLEYDNAEAFISDLKKTYESLPEESFPLSEREAFYAQVKDNFDATGPYYQENVGMSRTRTDRIESNLIGNLDCRTKPF